MEISWEFMELVACHFIPHSKHVADFTDSQVLEVSSCETCVLTRSLTNATAGFRFAAVERNDCRRTEPGKSLLMQFRLIVVFSELNEVVHRCDSLFLSGDSCVACASFWLQDGAARE